MRELHGDQEVMRHLSVDGEAWPDDVLAGKLARFVAEQAAHGFSKWKVHRRSDGRFIGRAGFSPFEGGVELGLRASGGSASRRVRPTREHRLMSSP